MNKDKTSCEKPVGNPDVGPHSARAGAPGATYATQEITSALHNCVIALQSGPHSTRRDPPTAGAERANLAHWLETVMATCSADVVGIASCSDDNSLCLFHTVSSKQAGVLFEADFSRRMKNMWGALAEEDIGPERWRDYRIGNASGNAAQEVLKDMLNVPLVVNGRLAGLLAAGSARQGTFDTQTVTRIYKVCLHGVGDILRLSRAAQPTGKETVA